MWEGKTSSRKFPGKKKVSSILTCCTTSFLLQLKDNFHILIQQLAQHTTPGTCVVSAVQFGNQLIKVCTANCRRECWSCLWGRGLTWCLSDCPCATVSVSPQLGAVLSSHTLHIIMARLYTDITAPLWVLNCHHQTYESQWTILDLNSLFASVKFAWFKLKLIRIFHWYSKTLPSQANLVFKSSTSIEVNYKVRGKLIIASFARILPHLVSPVIKYNASPFTKI